MKTVVKFERLRECLCEDTIDKIELLIQEVEPERKPVTITVNSNVIFKYNKCIALNTLYIAEEQLKDLAKAIKAGVKTFSMEYELIRPDVLIYITNERVSYRPIIESYSYTLPANINLWTRLEK